MYLVSIPFDFFFFCQYSLGRRRWCDGRTERLRISEKQVLTLNHRLCLNLHRRIRRWNRLETTLMLVTSWRNRALASASWLKHALLQCPTGVPVLLTFPLVLPHTANVVNLERSSTLSGVIRLRGRQRGRAIIPRRRGDHRDERADRWRQLDGGCTGTGARETRHVPHQLCSHVAGLTFGKPELVGERL